MEGNTRSSLLPAVCHLLQLVGTEVVLGGEAAGPDGGRGGGGAVPAGGDTTTGEPPPMTGFRKCGQMIKTKVAS